MPPEPPFLQLESLQIPMCSWRSSPFPNSVPFSAPTPQCPSCPGGLETDPRTRRASAAPSTTAQAAAPWPQAAARAQHSGRGPSSEGRCGPGSGSAPAAAAMAGLEPLYAWARPAISRPQDALVCGIHWELIRHGYRCLGAGDQVRPELRCAAAGA